ncbi:protein kinase domain-containing protein [Ureibacillus manganicus]|uniref:Serine/threonine protein kinase n=1 Tax=Ureibacillus manganicus DSM 26584 TaxID=1384049 RepID=A0A0A3I0S4_9BACL|nr:serine/threonine protein kinase [Ureibacillus manganicus]KGR78284.1 serine/threonine protein kinase [Ureibacillus manganicus DSM 26584]
MDNLIDVSVGNMSFQLKEKHNFEWFQEFGSVFMVFSEQDSGNISFGVEKDGVKKFVKYAGAKTINFSGEPSEAIETLKDSVNVYHDLQHPYLVNLLDSLEIGEGFALVFEWFEGENLHPHWTFPPPHKYTHPDSPYFRFRQLPITDRLRSFQSLLEFHVHVEQKGYVAVDFYDGSILYDFKNSKTKICDIDLYRKKPLVNTMGRMWGSQRFMSPEEFELGANIDERTNVFNIGAIAFGLLGGELDRSITKWEAGDGLHKVAMKVVSKDRNERYPTVEDLYFAWKRLSTI